MKKSTWILIALIIGLGALVYFTQGKTKNYNEGDQLAIKNTSEIYKVFIADRTDKRILLTRGTDGWTVNEKYPVREGAINLLLETLNKVRVKSYVARAAEQNVVNELKSIGIKVEVYDKNDDFIKVLYVGGAAPGKLGTYMIQEGDNHLYITHLGSWEGVLTPRFMVNELDWRDKGILKYNPDDIKEISVSYPGTPSSSFALKVEGKGKYEVFPQLPEKAFENKGKEPIKAQVLYYLKGFERVVAEAFETTNPKRDSVVQTTPFCIINITDKNEVSKNIKLYPIPGRISGTLPDGSPRRAAIERYFASIDDNDSFMLVQHLIFKRLLAQYDFFFTEAEKTGK